MSLSAPFLKWAGGKRWLIAANHLPVPHTYTRYIEPFLGGGAVFFHLQPKSSILSDINGDLIELYTVIRDDPIRIQRLLEIHHALHSRDYYYDVRSHLPNTPVERAARTLYLNRTCWNGLYRVNLKGEFNVPIGTKNNVVFDGEDFAEFSRKLKGAEIIIADFDETISRSGDGDFIFIDPPYTVKHNVNGFIKYNERIFSWADQVRLRDAVAAAAGRGAAVVVTNADHESVRSLYANVCSYRKLSRASVLAGDSARRGPTSEAMFLVNL